MKCEKNLTYVLLLSDADGNGEEIDEEMKITGYTF